MSRALTRCVLSVTLACAGAFHSTHVVAEQLTTVVVTPTRSEQSSVTVPAGIKIISASQIRDSGASSVSEVLSSWGGVYVSDLFGDGTDASVSMRGSEVLIIIDGRRINNVDIRKPDLNSVSIKDIERIEIIQGSAGALYGDQAVGGVINIVTRSSARQTSSVEVAAGSYSRRKISAVVSEALQDDTRMHLSFDTLQTDNYRDNNELTNSNVLGRLDHNYGSGSVFVELQQIDTSQELPGALIASEVAEEPRQSFVNFVDDYATSLIHVMRTGVNLALNDNLSFEMELSSRDEDREIQQSSRFSPPIGFPLSIDNNQRQVAPKLVGAFPVTHGDILMTLGVDRINTHYDSEITMIDDKQNVHALYGQFVVPIYHGLDVTLGARKSRVKNDVQSFFKTGVIRDTARAKEIGLSYKPVDALRLFVRYDENFRFARVDEFTYTSPGEELDNQKGKSRELGFEWRHSTLALNALVYQLALEDEIAFDSSAPEPVGATFTGANVNFDPTTHEGLMLDASYRFSQYVSMNASFSYVDARFDSGVLKDMHISGIPQRNAALGVAYRHTEKWNAHVDWVYTGEQYLSGDNTNSLPKQPSHSVINANIQYEQGLWLYGLRINNLLNREYLASDNSFGGQFPAPELNLWLSARYSFE
jgi:iron complex outermembrane receptor protein